MATAKFIATVDRASEEAFDSECDACKLDEKVREAIYYCPDCEDYLCCNCEKHHKKVKATRFHAILSVSEMAKDSSRLQTKKTMKHICPCGQNEEINYFCADHGDCFCLLCRNVKHRRCHTATVEMASSDDSVVTDFTALGEKTNDLIEKAEELQKEHKKLNSKLEQMEETGKETIRKFRSKLNLVLNELERESLGELQLTIKSVSNQLEDSTAAINSALQLLHKDEKLVQETKKTQDKRSFFIASSELRKSLQDYETVLEDVNDKLAVPEIVFEQNKSLADLQNLLDSLGKVYINKHSFGDKARPVLLNASVKRNTKIDIKSLSGKENPSITGAEFLRTGEVLIADHGSSKLALLDTLLNIKSSLKCDGPPYDITIISDTEAVATVPYQQTLLYVLTCPKLQISRKIHLDNRCWGITRSSDSIYVTCNYSGERPEILELDMEGTVKRVVTCNQLGKSQCYIFNIAANQEGTRLYLSDYWLHKVICLNTDGNTIFTYSASDMKYPRGILVDGEGNALVCCESSNNIHVIKSHGSKVMPLLTSKDGVQTPFAISYRASDGMLVVGCWKNSSLLIFSLNLSGTAKKK